MDEKTDFILEVFDLLRAKFKRGDCTKEQTDAMYRVLSENLPIWATSDELAEHYGKSKAAVNGIIKRKMTGGTSACTPSTSSTNLYLRTGQNITDSQRLIFISPTPSSGWAFS